MIYDVAYISKNPNKNMCVSLVNCLVPDSKLYMFKPSDNSDAQHWRSDVHKCYNNARMDIPKGILLSQKYISTLRQSKASTKNSDNRSSLK